MTTQELHHSPKEKNLCPRNYMLAVFLRKVELASDSSFFLVIKFLIYAMPFSHFSKLHVNKRSQAGSSSLCTLQGNIALKRKA